MSSIATSTRDPMPSWAARNSPASVAMAAFIPAQRSPIGRPERTGLPPISPVSDMPPPSAWTIMSKAGRSR